MLTQDRDLPRTMRHEVDDGEQQYAEHSGSLILLNVEPSYAVLRDDARFKSLVHRVGLDRPPSAGSHALVR